MHPLYPAIKPYKSYELAVVKPHVLYVEETGDPKGIPMLVLHSGPGAGGCSNLRRFFDPECYRIINFDQRGSGRSTPHAELGNNTTDDLLKDIETIRDYLGLDYFFLFGGGWGSLLALLYAELHPEQVQGLLLHQIFLGRKRDIDWFYHQGTRLIYPDYWQEFCDFVPEELKPDIYGYYAECLQGDNEVARMAAAKSWALWKARSSTLQPNAALIDDYLEPHFARNLASIESHYLKHHFFIEENQVINNINKIKHIPSHMIHGRYDMICPLMGAWELHESMPASQLSIVRDAGHSYLEAGLIDAIVNAGIQLSHHGLPAG